MLAAHLPTRMANSGSSCYSFRVRRTDVVFKEGALVSEYQYYEFAAVDESLTDKQMEELRALSTRAEIAPTSFVNEYHWGDFKGDPRKLIVDYFDAFLYFANWGTLWCMFRLPKVAVDLSAMKRFNTDDAIEISTKGKRVIVDICLEDEAVDYDGPYEQTIGPLIPSRPTSYSRSSSRSTGRVNRPIQPSPLRQSHEWPPRFAPQRASGRYLSRLVRQSLDADVFEVPDALGVVSLERNRAAGRIE